MGKTPKYLPGADKAMSAEEADEGDACCPTCGAPMAAGPDTSPEEADEDTSEEAPSTFAKKFMAHKRGEA